MTTRTEGQQLGLALKDAVLDRMTGPWLERARAVARQLGADREITIDDVLAVVGPAPRQNLPGAVFRGRGFRAVGFDISSKPVAHGNRIRRWVYDGERP